MSSYIDGFVYPISKSQLSQYRHLVTKVAQIWQEHGALGYHEFVGDDMVLEGTRSFAEVTQAAEDEVIVFGWVEFASRQERDEANQKVAADPRMAELFANSDLGFDSRRMAYAGFVPFVELTNLSDER